MWMYSSDSGTKPDTISEQRAAAITADTFCLFGGHNEQLNTGQNTPPDKSVAA